MPPGPEDSESSTQTKRAACNRCHAQKLRCVPDPAGSRNCVRCRRKGSKCVYGPPRRMGRPRAQSSAGDDPLPSDNTMQTDTVAAVEDPSNQQQWRNPSHDELRHHSVSTTGDDLSLPMFNDFSFLDTPPPSLMSPSQLPDRSLPSDGPLLTADDFDLTNPISSHMDLEPFHGADQIFDPRIISDGSEELSSATASTASTDQNRGPSPISPPPTEDEQIHTLSNLSLTLFQCNRSLTRSPCTQDPLHALHAFSLCSLIPTHDQNTPPTNSNNSNTTNVQIDKLLEHTRTLKQTLKTLWLLPQPQQRLQNPHRPATGTSASSTTTDQATTLLGLSCYLRLLQIYNTLLDNISRSLKLLRTLPSTIPTSEIRVGTFALSSTQSLQLVLYLISQLLSELQYVVANRRCAVAASGYSGTQCGVPGWNVNLNLLAQQQARFPMAHGHGGDVQAHPHPYGVGVPQLRQEKNDGLEETGSDIRELERCVQEKIGVIMIELHYPLVAVEGVGVGVVDGHGQGVVAGQGEGYTSRI
ncbi:hypothetical protein BDV06DRAFT_227870 [Aspergillus oleicola]